MGSFSDCGTLAEVVLGKNLCTIGNSAFYFSDALTNITVPDNLQAIGTYAFGDSIQYVYIPDSVTYIPEELLMLPSICTFTSQNKTQIGYYTDEHNILFYGRKDGTAQIVRCPRNGVEKYIVPDNVTEIGAYAFADRYICEISFPDGLSSIGNYAFDGNSLKHVTLNPSLTVVGKCAFQNNPLDTLTIPDSLTTIGEGAFEPKRIVIPDSVTYVAPYFAQSTRTEAYIVYDTDGVGYFDEDCVLYYADPDTGDILLAAFPPAREITEYSVLPGTKVIAENAFFGNAALTAIHVPSSVEEIRTNAEGCNALQSIYFAGNAPDIHGSLANAILHYNIGRSGWTTPYWTDAENMRHQTAVLLPDLNSDGMFDYYDITKLYSCFRGKTTLPKDTYTDFDGDGTFGYYDITRLYGIYRDGGVAGNGDNGFDVEPKITTIGTIEYKASVSGTLYYYYAKTNEQPSPDKFLSNWRSAREYGNVDVIRNRTATMSYKTSVASTYPYIVFCILDGYDYLTPYVLDITYNSGFTVDPYVSAAEQISFKTSVSGTVRWYFAKYSDAPTSTEFTSEWNAASSSRSGKVNASSTNYGTIDFDSTYASSYPYIVVMLTANDGTNYQPVVVDVLNSSNSGFTVAPYCDAEAEKVYFKTSSDGYISYYFSRSSSTSGLTEDFDTMYDYTANEYKGTFSVKDGQLDYIDFSKIDTGRYPYIVMMFTDKNGNDYLPTFVKLSTTDNDDGSNTRGTGFRSVDRTLNGTTLDVTFTPDVDGTVYFSSSASGSTGQTMSVTAGSQYSMSFDVSAYLKYEGITDSFTITMQLTSGSKIYERVTLLDTGK